MVSIQINGKPRQELGKQRSKEIRQQGGIPGVIYGGDEVIHFYTTLKEVKDLVYSPDFKVADVVVEGKGTFRCIVKDLQYHPIKEHITHIDFLRLVDGHPVKVEVPLRFKGVSPGVKLGGKLQQSVRRIKIKTTPENLVDQLFVNVSKLELGQSARVRDIESMEHVEVLMSPSMPVATVEIPRALRSAAAAAEKTKG